MRVAEEFNRQQLKDCIGSGSLASWGSQSRRGSMVLTRLLASLARNRSSGLSHAVGRLLLQLLLQKIHCTHSGESKVHTHTLTKPV